MSELYYLAIMFIALGAVVVAAWKGLSYLVACGVFLGLATSVLAGKVINILGFDVSSATCLFAAIFLCTDVTAEVHGRKAALGIVLTTFAANITFLVIGQLVVQIPTSGPAPVSQALDQIFAFLPRLMLGGLLAFLISQTLDVYIFGVIRNLTSGKYLWLRNNGSTMVSQFVDTLIVWYVAFYGLIPDLWPIIIANYAVKLIAAAIDTPFAYFGVRLAKAAHRD